MSVVINTNVDSLKIQSMLNASTNKLSTSMQRMSSGLKILSAKDDAAGTVISERMGVQLNGNQIAQKNVQNANAMLSTAESNIDTALDNVSRIRDLALQAKNGTYSDEEISAMQDEVSERIAEINRVSNSSKYSQINLFGEASMANGVTFQVGANATADDVIKADGSIFGSIQFHKLTGTSAGTEESWNDPTEEAFAAGSGKKLVEISETEYKKLYADAATKDTVKHIQFCKDTEGTEAVKEAYYQEVTDVPEGKTEATLPAYNAAGSADYASYKTIKTEKVDSLDLTTLDEAGFVTAINNLDKAIDDLTGRKSLIGSTQNRLDSALDVLSTQFENLSSAKSIITDADIASEASSFTQQQILQQVSTSLLAQANQAPSVALSLI